MNYYQKPLVADHASMQYVWDVDGQPVSGFLRRDRHRRRGPLQSEGHEKDQGAGRSRCSTRPRSSRTKRSVRWPRNSRKSRREIAEEFFHEFRNGSERGRHSARAHGQRKFRHCGAATRATPGGSSLARGLTALAPWRWPARSGGHRRTPQSILLPLPARTAYPDCGVACANDVENLIQTATSGRHRGIYRRADSGRGRIHYASAGIFPDRGRNRAEPRRRFSSAMKCRRDGAARAGSGSASSSGA